MPDPVLIFVGLITLLMEISAVGASAAWSAVNPLAGETLVVKGLLSEQSLQLLITETPRTYAAFAPLLMALTIMLGAGVADRSGLFVALLRIGFGAIPERALVPAVMLVGAAGAAAADMDDHVGLARLLDRFWFGEVDSDGTGGCAEDDAAEHLA